MAEKAKCRFCKHDRHDDPMPDPSARADLILVCQRCGAAADEDGHCESCFEAESAMLRRENWAVDTAEGDR